jgi:hypothetical protein
LNDNPTYKQKDNAKENKEAADLKNNLTSKKQEKKDLVIQPPTEQIIQQNRPPSSKINQKQTIIKNTIQTNKTNQINQALVTNKKNAFRTSESG